MAITISGANFLATPTVVLGGITIAVTFVDANTLVGIVPAGIAPGVYALTVWNPPPNDVCPYTLSPAYTALSSPATTLVTGELVTFGPSAPTSEGDNDHVQEIVFEVPNSYTGDLYLRILDADTGGAVDEMRSGGSTMRYTLNGNGQLAQITIGTDAAYDNQWVAVFGPHAANTGSGAGSSWVFELVIEGISGDDGNIYNVALSTDPLANTAPLGSRAFAYSWTFPLRSGSPRRWYPYVPSGTTFFEQWNFDMDDQGQITLQTPIRQYPVPASGISSDNASASSVLGVDSASEVNATWAVILEYPAAGWNDLTFWAAGDGAPLAIFTQPTTSPAP